MITLVLLYVVKNCRLVCLLVRSKDRSKHVKKLVLPFRHKRYIELRKSIKMVFLLFMIQLFLFVCEFRNLKLLIAYFIFLIVFSV